MKIDGREIASEILENLKQEVIELKNKGITPHLYVLLLTDDPSTKSYVNQKSLKIEQIGAKITVEIIDPKISTDELLQRIEKLNNDKKIHGIIVQRPVPPQIDEEKISKAIKIEKDVDGFHPNSKFGIPVSLAVLEILKRIHTDNFERWLKTQKITVVGKGLTAGGPITRTLQKMGIEPQIITSKTDNRINILKTSDLIISCVGKPKIIDKSMLKEGVILIGVGMHKEADNKFHGDFSEENIEDRASFYTPTPGGVGPVNVSMLLSNLILAAKTPN